MTWEEIGLYCLEIKFDFTRSKSFYLYEKWVVVVVVVVVVEVVVDVVVMVVIVEGEE
jgi:hypothetical protein